MAAPAFRESGKPAPGNYVYKSGAGEILAAPGEGKAYVIYDLIFSSNSDGELQYADGGANIFVLVRGCCSLRSPIQWPANTAVWFEGGADPLLTLTYEIIDV
jgi:hypothetical protein